MEGGLVVRSLEGGLWCPSGRMVLDKGLDDIVVNECRYMLHCGRIMHYRAHTVFLQMHSSRVMSSANIQFST